MPRFLLLRRTTYANVVSTLALVVALGGTSYAAVQLASGQVKTRHLAGSAVTSAKVKDGTIAPNDLAAASKQRLWSSVYVFPGGVGTELTNSIVEFHSLTVPKGTYLVTAAAEFDNLSGQANGAICDVVTDGPVGARYLARMASGETLTLGGQTVLTFTTTGTILLRCSDTNAGVNAIYRRDSSLTALRIHQNTDFTETP